MSPVPLDPNHILTPSSQKLLYMIWTILWYLLLNATPAGHKLVSPEDANALSLLLAWICQLQHPIHLAMFFGRQNIFPS